MSDLIDACKLIPEGDFVMSESTTTIQCSFSTLATSNPSESFLDTRASFFDGYEVYRILQDAQQGKYSGDPINNIESRLVIDALGLLSRSFAGLLPAWTVRCLPLVGIPVATVSTILSAYGLESHAAVYSRLLGLVNNTNTVACRVCVSGCQQEAEDYFPAAQPIWLEDASPISDCGCPLCMALLLMEKLHELLNAMYKYNVQPDAIAVLRRQYDHAMYEQQYAEESCLPVLYCLAQAVIEASNRLVATLCTEEPDPAPPIFFSPSYALISSTNVGPFLSPDVPVPSAAPLYKSPTRAAFISVPQGVSNGSYDPRPGHEYNDSLHQLVAPAIVIHILISASQSFCGWPSTPSSGNTSIPCPTALIETVRSVGWAAGRSSPARAVAAILLGGNLYPSLWPDDCPYPRRLSLGILPCANCPVPMAALFILAVTNPGRRSQLLRRLSRQLNGDTRPSLSEHNHPVSQAITVFGPIYATNPAPILWVCLLALDATVETGAISLELVGPLLSLRLSALRLLMNCTDSNCPGHDRQLAILTSESTCTLMLLRLCTVIGPQITPAQERAWVFLSPAVGGLSAASWPLPAMEHLSSLSPDQLYAELVSSGENSLSTAVRVLNTLRYTFLRESLAVSELERSLCDKHLKLLGRIETLRDLLVKFMARGANVFSEDSKVRLCFRLMTGPIPLCRPCVIKG